MSAPTPVTFLWDDELAGYDHGPGHPLRPVRLELTLALARSYGLLERPGLTVQQPRPAADDLLELVHDPAYVGFVKRADDPKLLRAEGFRFGFASADNPVFPEMHEASALVSGASADAAAAVWEGRSRRALNIAGGLHHAMRDRASGFCVYDDPAVAIAWLLAHGAQRVAYVDIDVHHGDGVQAAFYADPRVLTISLHESGVSLFPGTGFADETGVREGTGYAVNVALPSGTGDAGWHRAFEAVVPELLAAYQPEVLVTQHGCDTHKLDPLAHLTCTVDGQRRAYHRLGQLAETTAGGKWVALGGGGYSVAQVVPRAWTHLIAAVTGVAVDGPTPEDWQQLVRERAGEPAPTMLRDRDDVIDVAPWHGSTGSRLDESIAATRRAVFPAHGLEP